MAHWKSHPTKGGPTVGNGSQPSTWHPLDPEIENRDVIASQADPDPPNKEVDEEGRERVAGPTVSLQQAHYTDRTAYVQNPKGVPARKIQFFPPKSRISHSIPAMSGSPDPSPRTF